MEGFAQNPGEADAALAFFNLGQVRLRVELATPENRKDGVGTFCLNGIQYVLITIAEGRKASLALTRREREIALQVAQGSGTKQIAHDLGISPHTAVTYINRIRIKLGVRNRPQMVAALLRD